MTQKWKSKQRVKVVGVDTGDKLYHCNQIIYESGGLLVKALVPIRKNSQGMFWFRAEVLKDYPEIKDRDHLDGYKCGEVISLHYAYIDKLTEFDKRELRNSRRRKLK